MIHVRRRQIIPPWLLETFHSFWHHGVLPFEQQTSWLLCDLSPSELLVLALGDAHERLAWLSFVKSLVHYGFVQKAELLHTMLCHNIWLSEILLVFAIVRRYQSLVWKLILHIAEQLSSGCEYLWISVSILFKQRCGLFSICVVCDSSIAVQYTLVSFWQLICRQASCGIEISPRHLSRCVLWRALAASFGWVHIGRKVSIENGIRTSGFGVELVTVFFIVNDWFTPHH